MNNKVWVVLKNDFPDGVFASLELAEIYMNAKRLAELKDQHPPGPYPKTYYTAYPYQVVGEIK